MKDIIIDLAKQQIKDNVKEGVIVRRFGNKYDVSIDGGAIVKNVASINNVVYSVNDRVTLGLIEGRTNKMRILGKAQVKRAAPETIVYL